MGHYLVNAVLNGLEGKEFEGRRITGKGIDKGPKSFDVKELAFLVTIAHRQPDPGFHGNPDTISWLNTGKFAKIVHVKKEDTVRESRAFLMREGLVDFRESEEYNGVTYRNVYRLLLKKIRSQWPMTPEGDRLWEQEILGISDKDRQRFSPEVWQALQLAPRNKDVNNSPLNTGTQPLNTGSEPRNTGNPPRNTGSEPRNTGTNNTRDSHSRQQQTTPSTEGGVVDERVVRYVRQEIAEVTGEDISKVGVPVVRMLVAEKDLELLLAAIRAFKKESWMDYPAGALVSKLKEVEAKGSPEAAKAKEDAKKAKLTVVDEKAQKSAEQAAQFKRFQEISCFEKFTEPADRQKVQAFYKRLWAWAIDNGGQDGKEIATRIHNVASEALEPNEKGEWVPDKFYANHPDLDSRIAYFEGFMPA